MLQVSMSEAVRVAEPLAVADAWGGEEQKRHRSDMNLAAAVQRQMLPRNPKQLRTVQYGGLSAAAREIGGDYYDFLDLGANSLGFVLADVSGKGIAAALLMANLQAAVRCECAHEDHDLGAMLERVNLHFLRSTLPQQYATLFFGRYDERTRQLVYVNCGHQPAILRRADGSVERLKATALPLGMVAGWTAEAKTVTLQPGDALYVCSDGVTEAGIESGCEFGEDGMLAVIAADPDQNVECTMARIARAVRAYAPNGLSDDMTIIGLQVTGA